MSIHPKSVCWERGYNGTAYSSRCGIVFLATDGTWQAQPGSHIVDESFHSWREAARFCEQWHGARSKATDQLDLIREDLLSRDR